MDPLLFFSHCPSAETERTRDILILPPMPLFNVRERHVAPVVIVFTGVASRSAQDQRDLEAEIRHLIALGAAIEVGKRQKQQKNWNFDAKRKWESQKYRLSHQISRCVPGKRR